VCDNIVEACIVVSSCTKMSGYKDLRAAQLPQLFHDRGINTRRLKKLDLVYALEEFDSDNNERPMMIKIMMRRIVWSGTMKSN